jgi:hypothetical protein
MLKFFIIAKKGVWIYCLFKFFFEQIFANVILSISNFVDFCALFFSFFYFAQYFPLRF